MNSHGTCFKLFDFQGEASPLIDADKPAVELADSISWLVLLSKDNITTADSLPYCISHMPWKNSVTALDRKLPGFALWAFVECVAGKKAWKGFWRHF